MEKLLVAVLLNSNQFNIRLEICDTRFQMCQIMRYSLQIHSELSFQPDPSLEAQDDKLTTLCHPE